MKSLWQTLEDLEFQAIWIFIWQISVSVSASPDILRVLALLSGVVKTSMKIYF
jgi:hypothetical protein